MKIFSKIDLNPATIAKIAGLALVALLGLSIIVRLFSSSFTALFPGASNRLVNYGNNEASVAQDAYYGGAPTLSYRNVAPNAPVPGTDAEEFEVTDYYATIETRNLENTCDQIAQLKANPDIIFETATQDEKNCNFGFKVANKNVPAVLALLESLDPKNLAENVYTIKRQIEDFTSEEEILTKKLDTITDTLDNAILAYDQITKLATDARDVESLAKIIDSKIRIIEQLTQQKIDVSAQLDRLSRAKAEQLDRLDFTYFNVYIYENKFVDGQSLKDSWKNAVQGFFRDLNAIAQDLTVNLAILLFMVVQYLIYGLIILLVAKYGWKYGKKIWQK